MNFLQIKRDTAGIDPEIIFSIGGFPISNTTLLLLLIAIVLFLFSFFKIRKFKIKPTKVQALTEILYEGIVGLINQITGSAKLSKRILPIIGTLLVGIGIANLVTLVVPGLTSITFDGVSIFRTPTADFNTTFSLALACVILTHIVSIVDWGFFGHVGKYLQFAEIYKGFRQSPSKGGLALVGFFVGILDVIGEFAKVVALSLRLFGNMYAGEVLMIVIFGGLAYLLPSLWIAMSLLTAVVQALVFGLLVAAYYTLAVKPMEDARVS